MELSLSQPSGKIMSEKSDNIDISTSILDAVAALIKCYMSTFQKDPNRANSVLELLLLHLKCI